MTSKEAILNPFSITSYMGPEYFCDRDEETKDRMYSNVCAIYL